MLEQNDSLWTTDKPTKPGIYRWRKDRKWEYIEREILQRTDGVLVIYSQRYENWVPLHHLDAGGSEWLVADLVAAGCRPAEAVSPKALEAAPLSVPEVQWGPKPSSKCVARRDIFRR